MPIYKIAVLSYTYQEVFKPKTNTSKIFLK